MKRYLFLALISVLGILQLNAQCYPDRHNTNWFDGWISCETAPNPNDSYDDSHWILYDFSESYELGKMHVWNSNDPANLDFGMQDVSIDYSLDGSDWINLGIFEFDMGTGKSIYEGFEGPDFEGAVARYVLLTGISNYGGDCYGLSEIRIEVEQSSTIVNKTQLDVKCAAVEEGVLLEWTVQGAIKGVSYSIERSLDTEQWFRLKETQSFTLDEGTHTFHYIDNEKLDGSAYYRLITKLSDGSISMSKNHYCSDKGLEARVYPNPMQSNSRLEIMTQEMGEIGITISDVFGRSIYSDSFFPSSITSTIELNDLKLSPGQYFVVVRQGEIDRAVKLVKM